MIAGRYELQNLIGTGGVGDVYRAWDHQTQTDVAVKQLRPELVSRDQQILERFLREGEMLRQLNHPNIIEIRDVVEQDGAYYLVMAYIASGSLRQLLNQEKRLPVKRALEIALDLTDALARAHRLNIVHRDLKPDNVLIADDGTPRLTDFGAAQMKTLSQLTQTGAIIGTVHYLSPEACNGEPLDSRSDIWSFGIMLYEMLSGQHPFPGSQMMAILTAILTKEPPFLSDVDPALPPALVDLVGRMMIKDREQRIGSIRQVGSELELLLQGHATGIRTLSLQGMATAVTPSSGYISSLPTIPPAPIIQLPTQKTPFIGRQEEVGELIGLLSNEDCRLLTLLGPGGIGKTRLSLEVAAQCAAQFAHGVYYVELAQLDIAKSGDTFHPIVAAIADALNFAFYGQDDTTLQLLTYLRDKSLLLILDSFEHLTDGADLVTEILDAATAVKIIITSREALNLHQEWLHRVVGMTLPQSVNSADLLEYSAIQLFVQSAQRIQRNFSLEQNREHVVRICQLVEGMPLGIELATAWLKSAPCAQIVQQIEKNIDFLATRQRDVVDRHRSLRAVFDYSWQLLSDEERDTLTKLAVFRGGFTFEAAETIARADFFILSSLVDKSLLRLHEDGRYDWHNLLRQYALEKLGATAVAQAQEQHAAYYAQFLYNLLPDLQGRRYVHAIAAIGLEIDNIRSSWRWAVNNKRFDQIAQMMVAVWFFYEGQEWLDEGRETFGLAIAHIHAHDPAEWRLIQAQLVAYQAWFYYLKGQHREGHDSLQRNLVRLNELGATHEKAMTLNVLGSLQYRMSQYHEAIPAFEAALALYQQDNNLWGQAMLLNRLGEVTRRTGSYDQAQRLYEQSLAIFRQIEYAAGISWVTSNLAVIAREKGDYAQAKALLNESLAINRANNRHYAVRICLTLLGQIAMLKGDYGEGETLIQEAYALSKARGDEFGIAFCARYLGHIYLAQQKYERAVRYYEKCKAVFTQVADQSGVVSSWRYLGDVARARGDYALARAHLHQSLTLAVEAGADLKPDMAETFLALGYLYLDLGQFERAAMVSHQAKQLGIKRQQMVDMLTTLDAQLADKLAPAELAKAQEWMAGKEATAVGRTILAWLNEPNSA